MKTNYDKLFDQYFDISEPTIGHFDRFKKRMSEPINKPIQHWKWISIAASIVLLFGVWFGQNQQDDGLELADVSPKMEETQSYFASLIRTEIEKVNTQRNDDNKQLIDDSFIQLQKLDEQYSTLTIELKESNGDQRVIFAMITNYQQRIEVLQNLLEQLNTLKQLKSTNYENYS